jgi:hypothetical protein
LAATVFFESPLRTSEDPGCAEPGGKDGPGGGGTVHTGHFVADRGQYVRLAGQTVV